MRDYWAKLVKDLRGRLSLNQQSFGALIGMSTKSVSHWENERAVPDRLSKLLLQLVAGALTSHSRLTVLGALREAGPNPDSLVLALTWLRQNPGDRKGTVRLPDTLLPGPPSSSAVPSSN